MPVAAEDLDFESRLRILLLGQPKAGKSSAVISTSPGPVRVLLCEDISALREAKRRSPKGHFDVELIGGWNSMQKAISEAKEDAAAGTIKTLVIDPLSDFADRVLLEMLEKTKTSNGQEDGRKAYPETTKRLKHLTEQLFALPCHVVVICHHMVTGGDGEGLEKTGQGIVPLLPGASRAIIAARFSDVIWFDLRVVEGKEERSLVTGPQGAWGPGCRSLKTTEVLPPDINLLIKRFNEQLQDDTRGSKPAAKPALRPVTSNATRR